MPCPPASFWRPPASPTLPPAPPLSSSVRVIARGSSPHTDTGHVGLTAALLPVTVLMHTPAPTAETPFPHPQVAGVRTSTGLLGGHDVTHTRTLPFLACGGATDSGRASGRPWAWAVYAAGSARRAAAGAQRPVCLGPLPCLLQKSPAYKGKCMGHRTLVTGREGGYSKDRAVTLFWPWKVIRD